MLSASLDRYLQIRRALGYELRGAERRLRSYVRFAEERGETKVVSTTAVEWARRSTTTRERGRRLRDVIGFARLLKAEDPRHEIPSGETFRQQQTRRTPYIFTDDEIRLLLQAASRLGRPGTITGATYTTLLGLLATTGMRVSEALSLRLDDLTMDGLLIRQTKFHKNRLIPVHPTTHAALERYLALRQRRATFDDHVFISQHRRGFSYAAVNKTFDALCRAAALPRQPWGRKVRMHDLRHHATSRIMPTLLVKRLSSHGFQPQSAVPKSA